MYCVSTHSFNGGGHFHYKQYFEDGDIKGKYAYIEETLKDFFKNDYKLEEIYPYCEDSIPILKISLFKKTSYGGDYAEIFIQRITTNKEYVYEC